MFRKHPLHRKLKDPDQSDLRIEDTGEDGKIFGLRRDSKEK